MNHRGQPPAPGYLQLTKHRFHVRIDGVRRNPEAECDLFVSEPVGEKDCDIALARSQWIEDRRKGRWRRLASFHGNNHCRLHVRISPIC